MEYRVVMSDIPTEPSTSAALSVLGVAPAATKVSLAELDDATLDHLASSISRWWHRGIKVALVSVLVPPLPVVVMVLLSTKAPWYAPLVALGLIGSVAGGPFAAIVSAIARRVMMRLARDESESLALEPHAVDAIVGELNRALSARGDLTALANKQALVLDSLRVARARGRDDRSR
jgi:hypothetical protein